MLRRSYAFIGTGAIGGYYGACLQRAGFPVHFLVRSDYQEIQERGLIVESVGGDFTLPQVKVYRDVAAMPSSDVVVVALKATQNHLLSQLLRPVVKPNGVVLLLQNGLGEEGKIAEFLDTGEIIGGLCFICANKIGPGHIRHLDFGAINLAAYGSDYRPAGVTAKMQEIRADFNDAGIEIKLSPDLLRARWEKLVWNIPYNGLSVSLNATTEEIMANEYSLQLVKDIMAEVVLGAKSRGQIIAESFVEKMLHDTAIMKPYRTSMKLDYDYQRPLEVEAIVGNPLHMAKEAGVELPRIAMLYQQLKFLDERNRSK